MPSDGWCQFHSLYNRWCQLKVANGLNTVSENVVGKKDKNVKYRLWLSGKQVTPNKRAAVFTIRKAIGYYMWKKMSRFSLYFIGDKTKYQIYCQDFARSDGVIWGDNITLKAFCDLTSIPVNVYMATVNDFATIYPINYEQSKNERVKWGHTNCIHLHYNGSHYNAVDTSLIT